MVYAYFKWINHESSPYRRFPLPLYWKTNDNIRDDHDNNNGLKNYNNTFKWACAYKKIIWIPLARDISSSCSKKFNPANSHLWHQNIIPWPPHCCHSSKKHSYSCYETAASFIWLLHPIVARVLLPSLLHTGLLLFQGFSFFVLQPSLQAHIQSQAMIDLLPYLI